MNVPSAQSRNRQFVRRVAVLLCTAMLTTAAACSVDTAVAPELKSPVRREDRLRCVKEETQASPADTVILEDADSCPAGYDHVPWY